MPPSAAPATALLAGRLDQMQSTIQILQDWVTASILSIHERLNRLEAKTEALEERVGDLEGRVAGLQPWRQ